MFMSTPYEFGFGQPATIGMIALAGIAIAIIATGRDTTLIAPIIAAIPTLAGIDRYLHVRSNDASKQPGPAAQ